MHGPLTRKEVYSYEDIMNQFVWNNKYILREGKSLYHAFLHNTCGISKVGDLASKDNIFLGSEKVLNAKLTPSQYFLLMGVVSAIPNEWRSTIKGKSVYVDPHPFIENSFRVPIRGEMFDLLSVSSQTLHREFRSRNIKKFLQSLKLNLKRSILASLLTGKKSTHSLQCYFRYKFESISI